MKTRLIASIAVGAAVVLGTTGCNLIAPQATTIDYSASDGVNVPADSGPLHVRNALIVADEDGTTGNLVAAIVNDTSDSLTLRIEVGEGSSAVKSNVIVPANKTLSLGDLTSDTEPLRLNDIDAVPGSTVPVYFQSGDGEDRSCRCPSSTAPSPTSRRSRRRPRRPSRDPVPVMPTVTPSPSATPAS